MSPKKNNIKQFLKALPRNIFSGFVVSLIALPLGLGLAMASDAPPISELLQLSLVVLLFQFLAEAMSQLLDLEMAWLECF